MIGFQGPGIYELQNGAMMYCEVGGRIDPENIIMREQAGGEVLVECVPDVFRATAFLASIAA